MSINDIYEVNIIRRNNEGEGIAKIDDMIVFVQNALEDEIVKIKIDRIEKNFAHAQMQEIISKSKNRITPVCPYYKDCGGCSLMHENHESQLNFKKQKVIGLFEKVAREKINPNIYSFNELNYRNKVTLKVINNKIGFYKQNTNELVNIDKCLLADNRINDLIKELSKYDINDTNIMIRICNNKLMINFDKLDNKKLIDELDVDAFYINNKLVKGNSIYEVIDNFKFKVSPKSFFQVNQEVMNNLYKKALSYINSNDLTLDLYSGTGTLSILVSNKSKRVIAIEKEESAVADANDNLKLNNINNVIFICGKVEDKISSLKKEKIDNIIIDPPRKGINKKGIDVIREIKPNNLIYISCDPNTLVRDYNLLKDIYDLKAINLYDMFPQTYHIESLMVLERKN